MSLEIALTHRRADFMLDVAFTAPPGVTALFGRSGAGKTTVVRAVAGLLTPEAGRIAICGEVLLDTQARRNLPPHRRRLGYVFQEGRLFPHLTVRQNLLYGRWMTGAPKDAGFDRVVDLLGLDMLLARRPGHLSGGEAQRVALGRALLAAPRMLLMDEPLAALDQARKDEILPYLERIRDEAGLPILYVSHALSEVARLATTVVALDQGRVRRVGPAAEVLSDPGAAPALGLREAGAILEGRVAAHHPDGLSEVALPGGGTLLLPRLAQAPGRAVRVRIEAQDVMLALDPPGRISALNVLPARVVSVRPGAGPGALVQLEAPGGRLLARVTRRSAEALALAPGRPCYAVVKSVSVAQGDVGGGGSDSEI